MIWSIATKIRAMLLLLSLLFFAGGTRLAYSFRPPLVGRPRPRCSSTRQPTRRRDVLRRSQVSDEEEASSSSTTTTTVDFLQDAETLELSMSDHRPLGCTVEESLGQRYGPLVFCSKVTPGGFAEQAGIQPGDVFLGVSGMFGGMEDVIEAGIERVKALVAACPDDEPLVVRLARDTPVLADHEEAVVDLCSNPDKSDTEVDECVTDFLRAGYYTEEEDAIPVDDESTGGEQETAADNDNALLDNMFNMWAEDLPAPPPPSTDDLNGENDKQSKPKPWSSRSSPSGTFVRDPRTGKMTNIDS